MRSRAAFACGAFAALVAGCGVDPCAGVQGRCFALHLSSELRRAAALRGALSGGVDHEFTRTLESSFEFPAVLAFKLPETVLTPVRFDVAAVDRSCAPLARGSLVVSQPNARNGTLHLTAMDRLASNGAAC